MEREQGDNLRHQLDNDFDTLRSLLYAPDPSSTGSNAVPLGRTREDITVIKPATETGETGEQLDYDTHVRELAFEKRAQPKDRTKTEEEVARAEKEALEVAERRRRRRMLGEDGDSEEEDDAGNGKGRKAKKRKRDRGADDLDDDFDTEEGWAGLGAGLAADGEGDDDGQGEGAQGEESDEEESEEGSEESEEESDDGEDSDEEAEEGEQSELTSTKLAKILPSKGKSKELPFTFPCPGTHEEFLEIVDGFEDNDVPTVVKRIRALYHSSLAPENKNKLQALASVLIDHILYVTSPPAPRFASISPLLPHLYALIKAYPIASAESFVEKISLMHKNLKRGLSRGALDPEAKTWPGLPELSLLRVIGEVWPTSDMNHAVVTPARLLMGAYLGLGRVRSLVDVASGLFICTLFLQFEGLSKRLVPEAINFLVNTILHLCPNDFADAAALPGTFPIPDFRSESCKTLVIKAKKSSNLAPQRPDLGALLRGVDLGDQAKVDLLALSFELLARFADMYKSLDAFIELYQPVVDTLAHLRSSKLPKDLETRITGSKDNFGRLLKFAKQARKPLALQAHKPIPIPSYIPKFESTSSNYLRRQDPDHERNEASKLRHQYKEERKGAIRELRKDSRFLAAVEQKKQIEKDRAYKASMNKVFGSIEGERAEEKAMEREKAKDKRRSGRK
ncbi:hypothetical protein HWV62_36975 [Athelia sp. TMB]|nr:hypothetical protein HWV62_36975 [Athelia sp. TMB]